VTLIVTGVGPVLSLSLSASERVELFLDSGFLLLSCHRRGLSLVPGSSCGICGGFVARGQFLPPRDG
jgi:hypothetical protein